MISMLEIFWLSAAMGLKASNGSGPINLILQVFVIVYVFEEFLPLNNIIKGVVRLLHLKFSKLKFVSKSTVFEDNHVDKEVSNSPIINPTSKRLVGSM